MSSRTKKVVVGIAICVIGYLILFKTNIVISRMSSFRDWVARFSSIQAGDEPSSAIISIEDKDALRDDFVRCFIENRKPILKAAEGDINRNTQGQDLVWREGTTLYVANLGPALKFSAAFEPEQAKAGITSYLAGKSKDNRDEQLVFTAFIALYFDDLIFVSKFGEEPGGSEVKISIKELRKKRS